MADDSRSFPTENGSAPVSRDFRDRGTEPTPREVERLDKLATLLDSQFSIAGFRFGIDGLLGLIPGVGDAAALALSGYLILEAGRAGARKRTISKMLVNAGLDATIGTIPLVGDAFDFVFKANKRNIELLKKEMLRKKEADAGRRPLDADLR